MRRLFLACAAVLVIACVGSAQEQGKYLNSASAKLVKYVNSANGDGYVFANDSFSIGGGWLKQGKDRWVTLYTLTLNAKKTYRFIAVGDMDAKDVDLQVLNEDGKIVAQDTATAPEAIVGFTPTKTGRYTVRVRLYASRDNVDAFCIAAVLSR